MHSSRSLVTMGLIAAVSAAACSQAQGETKTIDTKAGKVTVEELASGLDHPWGLAFLPDGRLLITERNGGLRILGTDNKLSAPLAGVPETYDSGQGGLLDVALDPAFAQNGTIYISYAEPGGAGASTAFARATFADTGLTNVKVIFRQEPKVSGSGHFGGRIVFSKDGFMFLTTGERQKMTPSQDLMSHLGKVIRLNKDGTVPKDNPFVGRSDAKPEIWSYGHRNVQGAAIDPATGTLWTTEMGPRGGDELNHPQAGKNYGWPLVSWGNHYDGEDIPDPPTRPDLADATKYWNPVISPSGTIFYTGTKFAAWKGNLFISGLSSQSLTRLKIEGTRVTEEERINMGERIRDIEQAPDGSLIVVTDESNGKVWRLRPAN
jgi:aldose sugar dehydrogenase